MSHRFRACNRGDCNACPGVLPSGGGTACGCKADRHVCTCPCHRVVVADVHMPGLALALFLAQLRQLHTKKGTP